MTGHGDGRSQQNGVSAAAEIRTVNNRYFKFSLRSGEGSAALDSRIEAMVRDRIRRGSVTATLRIVRESTEEDYSLNTKVLSCYWAQLNKWKQDSEPVPSFAQIQTFDLGAMLLLPGVVSEPTREDFELEKDWEMVAAAFDQALVNLQQMRQSEGEAMAVDLTNNCQSILERLELIEQRCPVIVENYQHRLAERINKLLAEHEVKVSPSDVVREIGIFSDRCDISEETVRLRSHIEQFHKTMDEREGAGRKLEFLVQEMFREANTIGSKANDAEISTYVVDVKTTIERIREMIQNVE